MLQIDRIGHILTSDVKGIYEVFAAVNIFSDESDADANSKMQKHTAGAARMICGAKHSSKDKKRWFGMGDLVITYRIVSCTFDEEE